MDPQQVAELIRNAMPGAEVTVQSADGTHFEALVVSDQFEGQRTLQRHRSVYATLGDLVGGKIHALALRTLTRAERDAQC